MQVIINGEPCETQARVIGELVRAYMRDPVRVAVVLNGAVLPAAQRETTGLAEGDRIELLTFASGG